MTGTREPERFFTVEEADRLLASLRNSLVRIRDARRRVLRGGRLVSRPEEVIRTREVDEALQTLREEVEHLASQGVVLRDPETGAIDFPTRREGRIVYLCWAPEESSVLHWHEADHGLGARKPLDRGGGGSRGEN